MSSAGTSSQSTGDETAAVAQQLAEARAELAAMQGLQASFAHGVSHDLRAPLRAIDSFSALLAAHLDGGLDETSRDYIARIRSASARMAELIDALLELSRAMRAELQQAPVDIGLLVDWAHAELADADAGREARIEVQPGLQAWGDERQLRLLVTRLLHNAWKFSRGRERVQVEIGGERRDDRIVMHVRDHGSGFDMRYADKLFEPFQRLHGPEQGGGNGLGLAIVRCVTERHGGRVWAQSEPGAGSTFFVELPAVPDPGNQA
ncbi:ATP-binding protein [Luteimonas soli]|uniref:histidine kinase n=1 Tax=Luteimonas soli TaxID=1648966 RepID=A0ABV7XN04_9GAMM